MLQDEFVKPDNPLPFASFSGSISEILERLKGNLERERIARSTQLKHDLLILTEIRMRLLLYHSGLYRLARDCTSDSRWPPLYGLMSRGASEMGVSPVPIPILSESYESTGLFAHYDEDFRRGKDYYFVKVDASDPPIFWPLVFHELAHCRLSKTDYPDTIYENHQADIANLDPRNASYRIEEALCDVISTRLAGPAFCYSYLHKFWTLSSLGEDEVHPSHPFRLECMSRTLKDLKLFETAALLEEVLDNRFTDPWRNEPIASAIGEIMDVGKELFPRDLSLMSQSANASSAAEIRNVKTDVATLFLAAWRVLTDGTQSFAESYDDVNTTLLTCLEGWTKPSDTQA